MLDELFFLNLHRANSIGLNYKNSKEDPHKSCIIGKLGTWINYLNTDAICIN
jgi:hypothetical protein